jgi:[ribosomal protein S18]-alanine N-acetyltransferase
MIRGFQRRDLAALHRLDAVCFPPEIAYSRAELQYFLTHPNCTCWIAERPENKLGGFVIVERVNRGGRVSGHIVTLDVDPGERRCGLGTLLLNTVEEQMKQEGVVVISLEVAENNASARSFYRSLGFVPTGRIANYYAGRVDAEVMEKVMVAPAPTH